MQIGKCKIELPFFACLAGILLIDHTRYMGYLLASIALHEGAHLLALQIWGISVRRIVLSGFRIQIDLPEKHLLSYKQEMLIAAAGPAANFLLAALLYLCACLGVGFADAPFLLLTNLGIGLINLFPVEPLDGSKIARCMLFLLFEYELAGRIYLVVRVTALVALLLLGFSFFYLTGYNVSLMTICLFLSVRMLFDGEKPRFSRRGQLNKCAR